MRTLQILTVWSFLVGLLELSNFFCLLGIAGGFTQCNYLS